MPYPSSIQEEKGVGAAAPGAAAVSGTPAEKEARRVALRPPPVPASFFGIVLGLAGLANAWRAASQVWNLPALFGEALFVLAAAVWVVLVVLFALKWIAARKEAMLEARHPIQCCFIGLAGVATMLVANGIVPYWAGLATLLYVAGAAFTIGFGLWRTGSLWQGDRDPASTTPVLYLPTVAGGFVMAAGAASLGHADVGQIAFGAGFFSWLAIESVLLHRLYTSPAMAAALRPTLGIQMAPPSVGAAAYVSVNGGVPDMLAHAMIGYGILQALMLLRLLPWIRQQPFAASYWAFTFGATALATAPLRLIAHGDPGAISMLAPVLFVGANAVVGLVALGTLRLLAQGRLLPPTAAPAKQAAEASTAAS